MLRLQKSIPTQGGAYPAPNVRAAYTDYRADARGGSRKGEGSGARGQGPRDEGRGSEEVVEWTGDMVDGCTGTSLT